MTLHIKVLAVSASVICVRPWFRRAPMTRSCPALRPGAFSMALMSGVLVLMRRGERG